MLACRSGRIAWLIAWMVVAGTSQAGTFENDLIGLNMVPVNWPTLDGVDNQTHQRQRVAVLDTGLAVNHSGFFGLDGASRIVAGVNYASDAPYGSTTPEDYTDRHGHGTMVGGIIGSSHAMAPGIAPKVDLVSVRIADLHGQASLTSIANGLQWVVDHASALNITTVNISMGTAWTYSSTTGLPTTGEVGRIQSALSALESMNIIIAAGAGNNSSTTGLILPAIYPQNISVSASTDADNAVLSIANRSFALDMLAPGQTVTSLARGGGLTSGTGTSFASPFVAAAAVLAREQYTHFTDNLAGQFTSFQDRVVDLFQRTGKPITDPVSGLTFRRLDLAAALAAIDSELAPVDIIVLGDFDRDGEVTANDIDIVYAQIRSPDPDPQADINADGLVNQADMDQLIFGTLKTMYGDANLDGKVDTLDLVLWRNSFKSFGGTGWANGDFNGNGVIDTLDLVLWRNAFNGFGVPVEWRSSLTAVPEPATGLLMLLSASFLRGRRRGSGGPGARTAESAGYR